MTSIIKVFISLFLLLLIGCFNTKTPETYLIPDGYQGKITIVFEQDKGRDEEYEGNRRLYRIDTNGILITKFKYESGGLNQQYYYIKSNGSRQRINIDSTIFWRDSSRIKTYLAKMSDSIMSGYFGVAGRYGGGTAFRKVVPYSQSLIGNSRFMDTSDLDEFEKRQWKLLTSLLHDK
jgi:hypothetical protein